MGGSRDAPVTYMVGRSRDADIVLVDPTVSRLHAELVSGSRGTWFLVDRGSTGGTYRRDAGCWIPVRQEFVRPGDRLKLGEFECVLDDLLRRLPASAGARASSPPGPSDTSGKGSVKGSPGTGSPVKGSPGTGSPVLDDRPFGPVRRDPETGEIISMEGE